jgi:small subunit ribosomal protein S16
MGKRNAPFYRMVAAHDTKPRDGRFLEILGYYDPKRQPEILELKEERVIHWLSKGASPSDTARSLLRKKGILKRWHDSRVGTTEETAEAEGGTEAEAATAES